MEDHSSPNVDVTIYEVAGALDHGDGVDPDLRAIERYAFVNGRWTRMGNPSLPSWRQTIAAAPASYERGHVDEAGIGRMSDVLRQPMAVSITFESDGDERVLAEDLSLQQAREYAVEVMKTYAAYPGATVDIQAPEADMVVDEYVHAGSSWETRTIAGRPQRAVVVEAGRAVPASGRTRRAREQGDYLVGHQTPGGGLAYHGRHAVTQEQAFAEAQEDMRRHPEVDRDVVIGHLVDYEEDYDIEPVVRYGFDGTQWTRLPKADAPSWRQRPLHPSEPVKVLVRPPGWTPGVGVPWWTAAESIAYADAIPYVETLKAMYQQYPDARITVESVRYGFRNADWKMWDGKWVDLLSGRFERT